MKIATFLALSLVFAASTGLLAQQATPPVKEPPPTPPLLGSAPAECQWTVTYTPKTPEKEPTAPDDVMVRTMRRHYNPTILSKHVIKSGGQMVIYTDYEAGIKRESWMVSGYLYELPFRANQSIDVNSGKTPEFPDVDWINASNFRGTVDLKGTKVHLYELGEASTADSSPASTPSPKPATTPAKTAQKRAYIDAETRLPVLVDLGDTVLSYKYSGPAANFPTPDDRIKKIMRDHTSPPKK